MSGIQWTKWFKWRQKFAKRGVVCACLRCCWRPGDVVNSLRVMQRAPLVVTGFVHAKMDTKRESSIGVAFQSVTNMIASILDLKVSTVKTAHIWSAAVGVLGRGWGGGGLLTPWWISIQNNRHGCHFNNNLLCHRKDVSYFTSCLHGL